MICKPSYRIGESSLTHQMRNLPPQARPLSHPFECGSVSEEGKGVRTTWMGKVVLYSLYIPGAVTG